VQYKIELCPGYLKAQMIERDFFRVLISIRSSRPVFKVDEWNLSSALEKVMGLPGAFRTFSGEKAAVAWPVEGVPS
jgi:hypothetical protein